MDIRIRPRARIESHKRLPSGTRDVVKHWHQIITFRDLQFSTFNFFAGRPSERAHQSSYRNSRYSIICTSRELITDSPTSSQGELLRTFIEIEIIALLYVFSFESFESFKISCRTGLLCLNIRDYNRSDGITRTRHARKALECTDNR